MPARQHDNEKPVFRRLPYGTVLEVDGVPVTLLRPRNGQLVVSVPAELAPAFKRDGPRTILTTRQGADKSGGS